YSAISPCDSQIPNKLCMFRRIATCSTSAFGVLHVGIAVQRFQSSFACGNMIQKRTARVFIIASGIFSITIGWLYFYAEPLVGGLTPYCT
ncbi:hypothetical protein PMAYCL1PPCAC_32400, partial [Pristionchus mayeri]